MKNLLLTIVVLCTFIFILSSKPQTQELATITTLSPALMTSGLLIDFEDQLCEIAESKLRQSRMFSSKGTLFFSNAQVVLAEAEEVFVKTLERMKNSERAWCGLGTVCLEQAELFTQQPQFFYEDLLDLFKRAHQAFITARKINRQSERAIFGLGITLFLQGKLIEAYNPLDKFHSESSFKYGEQAFKYVLYLNPSAMIARTTLIHYYLHTSRIKNAFRHTIYLILNLLKDRINNALENYPSLQIKTGKRLGMSV